MKLPLTLQQISACGSAIFVARRRFPALALASALTLSSANAAPYYWDGGNANIGTNGDGASDGGDGTWSTAIANWDIGAAPHVVWSAGNTAIFAGTPGAVTLGSAITASGATFNAGGYSIDTAANTLTLAAPILVQAASGTTTFTGTVASSATQTWVVNAGNTLQFDAAFSSPTAANQFVLNSQGTTNITNSFSVSGKSTLTGTTGGIINLSGTEAFETSAGDYSGIQGVTVNKTSGTTSFSGGTGNAFFLGNTGTAVASALNITGGTVTIGNTRIFIGDGFSGVVTTAGDGTLSIGGGVGPASFNTGTGTLTAALGNNVATGTININTNGVLASNRAWTAGTATKGAINFNGGTLQALGTNLGISTGIVTSIQENGATIDSQNFAITIATNFTHGGVAATDGGLRIASTAGTPGLVTLSGIMSQTGGLTVNSNALISGNNSYTGQTVISAFLDGGTNSTVLGATGAGNGTTINTGGTFRFRDLSNRTIGEAFTFNGGTFLTFNDAGTTTLSGAITLNANTTISVSPQAQISTTLALTGGISDGVTPGNNLILSRVGAAGVASSDVINISAASTYGGTTLITDALTGNAGNFSVRVSGGDDRLPTGTVVTLGGIGGGGLAAGSGRLILGDATATSNQTLAGLVTGGTGTRNAVVGGNASTSTLSLNGASGTNTYGGLLGGTAANENNLALSKGAAGVLSLTAANTYNGGTTVNGGSLLVNNTTGSGTGTGAVTVTAGLIGGSGIMNVGANVVTVQGGAAIAPGNSPGALRITGTQTGVPTAGAATLNLLSNSNYQLELGGAVAGTGYDQIVLTGNLSLAGNLNISFINSFAPTGTTSYTIIDVAGTSAATLGAFASVNGSNAYNYSVDYAGGDGNNVVLTVTAVPEPSTYAMLLGGLGVTALAFRARRRLTRI